MSSLIDLKQPIVLFYDMHSGKDRSRIEAAGWSNLGLAINDRDVYFQRSALSPMG